MQQTTVLDSGLARPTPADQQPHHAGGHAAAPAATAELVARATLGEEAAWTSWWNATVRSCGRRPAATASVFVSRPRSAR